jgi:xanthine dehydrogenase small subunit
VAAAERIAATAETRFAPQATAARAALDALPRGEAVRLEHVTQRYFAPTTLEELLALRAQHPSAYLLAGGTDLALLVTKDHRRLDGVISLARVAGLREIDADPGPKDSRWLTVGAACTYSDLLEVLAVLEATSPAPLRALITRIGSRQIRNVATVCGNLANASPIADMPPALIALDATVLLDSLEGEREIALEELFLDYRRTALRPDEILVAVRFRFPRPDELFCTYKISKRWDQDIAAVGAGFRIAQADGIVTEARIAYGGMAATPRRAHHAEHALIGQPWTEATVAHAIAALDRDFAPISDWRAGAAYRRRVAGNLLRRFWLEGAAPDVPLAVMAL